VYGLLRPVPIGRRPPRLGCVGDDHAGRRFDRRQPALDRYGARRTDRPLQALRQWIVAARIEHEYLQRLDLLKIAHHVVHPGEPVEIGLVVEPRIDRHQIVPRR